MPSKSHIEQSKRTRWTEAFLHRTAPGLDWTAREVWKAMPTEIRGSMKMRTWKLAFSRILTDMSWRERGRLEARAAAIDAGGSARSPIDAGDDDAVDTDGPDWVDDTPDAEDLLDESDDGIRPASPEETPVMTWVREYNRAHPTERAQAAWIKMPQALRNSIGPYAWPLTAPSSRDRFKLDIHTGAPPTTEGRVPDDRIDHTGRYVLGLGAGVPDDIGTLPESLMSDSHKTKVCIMDALELEIELLESKAVGLRTAYGLIADLDV